MNEVMAGDQEKKAFLQKAAGYSLTGDTREQCLFDLWGLGANGKSTYLEILKAMMGQDYAYQAAGDTFIHKGIGQIPHDLAGMRGSRLVTLPDFEKGVRLNEALIKQVTGGDQISARPMYKGLFTYTPSYKLWLMGNHKPEIQDPTHGMWRRIHLIEFGVRFNKDNTLREQLLKELPGILNWAAQGCQAWLRDGLEPPTEVQEATAAYQEEMDVLGGFIKDRCILNPTAITPAATIYEAYTRWAEANGELNPLKLLAFGKALSEREFGRKHLNSGWARVGIALRPDDGVRN
jgi:putative DNA primase/helicase